jgi:hypothetical protein
VIVNEWMSLDGVVQAPAAADEDTTGGWWCLIILPGLLGQLPQRGGVSDPARPGRRR